MSALIPAIINLIMSRRGGKGGGGGSSGGGGGREPKSQEERSRDYWRKQILGVANDEDDGGMMKPSQFQNALNDMSPATSPQDLLNRVRSSR
jgi:hypothetical protein